MLKLKRNKKLMIPVLAMVLVVAMAGVALAFDPDPAMTSFPLTKKTDPLSYSGYALCVQRILDDHPNFSLGVDGYFGTQTETAVINYQNFRTLDVDGKVGNQTWSSLWNNELTLWEPQSGNYGYYYVITKPTYSDDCNIENNNYYNEWFIMHDNGVMQLIN